MKQKRESGRSLTRVGSRSIIIPNERYMRDKCWFVVHQVCDRANPDGVQLTVLEQLGGQLSHQLTGPVIQLVTVARNVVPSDQEVWA